MLNQLIISIVFFAVGSGIISAIESGFSGNLSALKKKDRSFVSSFTRRYILIPIKLFIFTFCLYLVFTFYTGLYSQFIKDPSLIMKIGPKSWSIVLAPIFGVLLCIVGCIYGNYKKQIKEKNL